MRHPMKVEFVITFDFLLTRSGLCFYLHICVWMLVNSTDMNGLNDETDFDECWSNMDPTDRPDRQTDR